MGKFTKLPMLFVFLLAAVVTYAQTGTTKKEPAKTSKTSKKKEETAKPAKAEKKSSKKEKASSSASEEPKAEKSKKTKSNTAASDTGKVSGKDRQNQLQFMKPDMESKNYNFYRRKEISTPLQPRYDLDSAIYQKDKKKTKQQQAYLNRQYAFPAKPKDQWEIGVNFGLALMSGDVKPYVHIKGLFQNIGAGFTVRKALGYTFSLRGGYNFMMMTGRNWEPDANLAFNRALHGEYDPRVNYWNNPNLSANKTLDTLNMNKLFFYNYRAYVHELHLEAVVNLGNIRFHRERNIVNFYAFGGVSTFFFRTHMNALNESAY